MKKQIAKNMKNISKSDWITIIVVFIIFSVMIIGVVLGGESKRSKEYTNSVRVVTIEGDTVTIEAKRGGLEVGIYKEQ